MNIHGIDHDTENFWHFVCFGNREEVKLINDECEIQIWVDRQLAFEKDCVSENSAYELFQILRDCINTDNLTRLYVTKLLSFKEAENIDIILHKYIHKDMDLLNELKELIKKHDSYGNTELLKEIKSLKNRLIDLQKTIDDAHADIAKLEYRIK
jgi:hypothetical protein